MTVTQNAEIPTLSTLENLPIYIQILVSKHRSEAKVFTTTNQHCRIHQQSKNPYYLDVFRSNNHQNHCYPAKSCAKQGKELQFPPPTKNSCSKRRQETHVCQRPNNQGGKTTREEQRKPSNSLISAFLGISERDFRGNVEEELTELFLCSAATARAKAIKSSINTMTKSRTAAMKTGTLYKLGFALLSLSLSLSLLPTQFFQSVVSRREKRPKLGKLGRCRYLLLGKSIS